MAEGIRIRLEWLFDGYPQTHQEEMKHRLQKGDFGGAVFELVVYSWLKSCAVDVAIHPDTPTKAETKPDFLVTCRNGSKFYVECTEVEPANARSPIITNATNSVRRYLQDNLKHPSVTWRIRKITKEVPFKKDLVGLMDKISECYVENPSLLLEVPRPQIAWPVDVPVVILTLDHVTPISKSTRQRAVVLEHGRSFVVVPPKELRLALRRKAAHYGQLDNPLLVAVNFINMESDLDVCLDAIYGTKQFLPMQKAWFRSGDGFWGIDSCERNTRVAGVLLVKDLKLWNLEERSFALCVKNGFDIEELSCLLAHSDLMLVDDMHLEESVGRNIASQMGLEDC